MVLIDKEVWDDENGTTFHHLHKMPKQNGGQKSLQSFRKFFFWPRPSVQMNAVCSYPMV